MDEDYTRLERALLASLEQLLAPTEWAPPEGGMLTDAVIVCGWREATGGYGRVYIDACAPWSAEGLLQWALRCSETDEDEP
jgi:hypothetical protein